MVWKNFDTENDWSTTNGPGICMAMTCHWIRQVYSTANRRGEGLSDAGQLRPLRNQVYNQQEYENRSNEDADNYIFQAYDLKGVRKKLRPTASTLIAEIRGEKAVYLFGALGTRAGHAMGIAHDGNKTWVFFDPNVGQRVFASEEAFRANLITALSIYQELRAAFQLYQVTPRLRGG